ncbi:MAG: phenylacetate--CoA ligase family protein [Planctomycetes bacterium]|nr:phenylacetate--CoA ligase family protein [Planctomycetota bacterium]
MNYRKILSWLYHKLVTRKQHWRNLKTLREWQWLPPDKLRAVSEERLRNLLAHAAAQVPYYSKLLREADIVDNAGKVNLDNFSKIPYLDKDLLRSNYDALTSTDRPKRKYVYTNCSGGSTGEPISMLQDGYYQEWNFPATLLGEEWTGVTFGQKRVAIWGSTLELLKPEEAKKYRWQRWLNNELFINATRVKPEEMRAHFDYINRMKPRQIRAITESIYDLARYIERNGLEVYSPHSIVTSAGTLFPHIREKVEEVFRCPVFDRYGSQEVGVVAFECEERQGLHVFSPVQHLEIIRPDGTPAPPGEFGEIIITPLCNYVMPLIRYRIGDVAAWAETPCSCGRGLPTLQAIKGRINNIFINRDGSHIHGQYFVRILWFNKWIRKFQVVQEAYDLVNIYIMLIDPDLAPARTKREDMDKVEERIRSVLGSDCRVEWHFVDEIPPTPSGKHLHTISRLMRQALEGDTP